MSTKIYNGYKINITSANKLREFCEELGQKIEKKRQELIARSYCHIIQDILFNFISGKQSEYLVDQSDDLQRNAFEYLREKDKSDRRSIFDFNFSIIFFPFKSKTLAMLFTDRKVFINIWKECPEVEEYQYFNNSDRPEYLNSRQWNTRRKDWDQALMYDVPSFSGLNFEPRKQYDLYLFSHELIYFDNTDSLINRQAYINLFEKYITKRTISTKYSELIKFRTLFDQYIKTHFGKRKLNIERLKLKKRAKNWENIRLEDLFNINKKLFWENNI